MQARWKWTWPLSAVSNNGQHKSLQSAVSKSCVARGEKDSGMSSFLIFSCSLTLFVDTWATEGCFQQHTRPGKHVCCVMEKSKSLPVNQFSAPCMLPRAEWQEEIQPQANKRAQHAEDKNPKYSLKIYVFIICLVTQKQRFLSCAANG